MTDADRDSYRRAFSALKTRAGREGRKIVHCRWHNGELDVLTKADEPDAPEPADIPQGSLL